MEIRQSYDCLISTMGSPTLIRQHLYIESGPWCSDCPELHDLFIDFEVSARTCAFYSLFINIHSWCCCSYRKQVWHWWITLFLKKKTALALFKVLPHIFPNYSSELSCQQDMFYHYTSHSCTLLQHFLSHTEARRCMYMPVNSVIIRSGYYA